MLDVFHMRATYSLSHGDIFHEQQGVNAAVSHDLQPLWPLSSRAGWTARGWPILSAREIWRLEAKQVPVQKLHVGRWKRHDAEDWKLNEGA